MSRSPDGPILSALGVSKRFGAVVVLENLDLQVRPEEAVGIVGPNGAGKTTLFSILAGALLPNSGSISFRDQDVTSLSATDRCRLGLARTHQIPRPFGGMTTFENIYVAASHGAGLGRDEAYDVVVDSLRLCGMRRVANRRAETLGLLDRKRLELARALATRPVLLLLDEIGGGLTDSESSELVETIRELRRRGIGIVWVEHLVHVLAQATERLVCINSGRVIADDTPKAVLADRSVIEAFLGGAPQ
jgi:branched-chain amino acid transport system ATP-binding protein